MRIFWCNRDSRGPNWKFQYPLTLTSEAILAALALPDDQLKCFDASIEAARAWMTSRLDTAPPSDGPSFANVRDTLDSSYTAPTWNGANILSAWEGK